MFLVDILKCLCCILFAGTGNVDLGYECSEDTDCADSHTQCSGIGARVCSCIYGYYGSNTPGKLGGSCNKSRYLINKILRFTDCL